MNDLDRLMTDRGIGLLIVPLHDTGDPSFRWISRGAKLTHGFVAKRPNGEAELIHFPMERDEARASGLRTVSALDLGWDRFAKESDDAGELHARFFRSLIGENLEGSLAILGNGPITLYHSILGRLSREGFEIWEGTDDLIQTARKKKDEREIELIRETGRRTERIVGELKAKLASASIDEGRLQIDGQDLTIGHLKDFVSRRISELGMVEDHETILSQGDEAAVPHSRGSRDRIVRSGETLVIDIFPADRASGYFFDYTRTLVAGEPPDRVRQLHAQVLEAFELAVDSCRAGMAASELQHLVCDFFESKGHATTRSDPSTTNGYVHGLGHGVGLEVHEKPSFSINSSNDDRIESGDVLTIEPGLYYPEERIGIRIEETFVVGSDGRLESMCEASRGLAVDR
ncbi:MAG: Xaa-Pro peptidase family protein [Thermoanaerobaculia bacterium]|nr:Xaa-Pro peptidase family protein [Thermoanaerobaculia bacterium]